MLHLVGLELLFQRIRNKGGTIIRLQPRVVLDFDVLHTGLCYSDVEHFFDIGAAHGRGQTPGEDVASIIVQHRTQVVIAPIHHLELGEIGLP